MSALPANPRYQDPKDRMQYGLMNNNDDPDRDFLQLIFMPSEPKPHPMRAE